MSKSSVAPRSALHDAQHDAALRPQMSVQDGLTIASVAARKGQGVALAERMSALFGVTLPTTPRRVAGSDLAVIWAGPEQWLVTADNAGGRDLEKELSSSLQGLASITDQSDGRSIVRVSGLLVAESLAKVVSIDLHDRTFKPGDVAITQAAHIPILIWRLPDAMNANDRVYELACPRSYSGSFWAGLKHAGIGRF